MLSLAIGLSVAAGSLSCGSTEANREPEASSDGSAEDATRPDAGVAGDAAACDPYAPFEAPRPVALGPFGDKTRAFFSDDELRVVFDVDLDDGDGGLHGEIFEATRPTAGADFAEGRRLVEINVGASQRYATLTADFRTVYFYSNPVATMTGRMYRATRRDLASPFGPPVELPALAVKDVTTTHAFPARHAPELWISAGDPNVGSFIYRAILDGDEIGPLVPVAELNEKWDDRPVLARDGLAVYWSRARFEQGLSGDIWVATRLSVTDAFRDLRPLSPSTTSTTIGKAINTRYTDYPVWISLDQCRLYSVSSAGQPQQEIFVANRAR